MIAAGSADTSDSDAVAQAELVRSGEVTPHELCVAAAERMAVAGAALNAIAVSFGEQPLSTADHAPAGPLHGVPMLLKDAGAALAGLPQYAGSGLLRSLDWRAPADTVLARRLNDAGLVFLGTSAMPEFGCQPTTQPLATGPTANPRAPGRSCGGSSGGAAAAVAAGVVPVAHAGDIGGSIRIPAAWCGVIGLKPTRGRVPIAPIVDPNLVEHVITRPVRDTAAVLDSVAGPATVDPYALPAAEERFADAVLVEGGPRLRVGLLAGDGETAPDCVAAAHQAAELLAGLGHHVDEASPDALVGEEPSGHAVAAATHELALVLDGLAAALGRPLAPADLEPYTWAFAGLGRTVDAAAYAEIQAFERGYTARILAWWNDYDLLLTPATGEPPPLLAELVPPPGDPLAILPRFRRIWCFAQPFNVTGQPAIALPIGLTAEGAPVGIQLVGAMGREADLLRVAAELERAGAFSV